MAPWVQSRWEVDRIDDNTHIWVKFGGVHFTYVFSPYELQKLQVDLLGHQRATHRPVYVNPVAQMQPVYLPLDYVQVAPNTVELSAKTLGASEIDQKLLPAWAKS